MPDSESLRLNEIHPLGTSTPATLVSEQSRLSSIVQRLWGSAVLCSWAGMGSRLLSLVLVTPLVLSKFETAEIAVWYLFASVLGFQVFFEFGFGQTFSRFVAYAMGGATEEGLASAGLNRKASGVNVANWECLEAVVATMITLFRRLGLFAAVALGIVGSFCLLRPISLCENRLETWIAWAVVTMSASVVMACRSYSCYLTGTDHIAPEQKTVAVTSLGAVATDFVVLLQGGGILGLVLSHQAWAIIGLLAVAKLARSVLDGRWQSFAKPAINPKVMQAVWPAAWRSGLGVIFTRGTLDVSTVIIAQLAGAGQLAAYLLGMRLIMTINGFAMIPFYTKLPTMAKARAGKDLDRLRHVARRGMRLAYGSYLLAFTVLGILGPALIGLLQSNADFPSPVLWVMLGAAFLLERYGAMHLQLYSTTNHIIWHRVSIGYAAIFISSLVLLGPFVGVVAVPIAMILGYALAYIPISTRSSYSSIDSSFFQFERTTALPAAIAFVLSSAAILHGIDLGK